MGHNHNDIPPHIAFAMSAFLFAISASFYPINASSCVSYAIALVLGIAAVFFYRRERGND